MADRAQDRTTRFVREQGAAAAIAALAEPVIEELGFRLVRVKITGRDSATVQIMADHPEQVITVDDCALISRRLSPLLDAHDPMPGEYHLEISSPGIDRPLVRPSDFDDWSGFEARIETTELIDGRRRFRGILAGYHDGEALLRLALDGFAEPQVIGLPVGLIHEARLAMTDDLIRAALARAKTDGAPGDGSAAWNDDQDER